MSNAENQSDKTEKTRDEQGRFAKASESVKSKASKSWQWTKDTAKNPTVQKTAIGIVGFGIGVLTGGAFGPRLMK